MQHSPITDSDCDWWNELPTEKMNFIKNQYLHLRVFKLQIEASSYKKSCAKRVKCCCGLITQRIKIQQTCGILLRVWAKEGVCTSVCVLRLYECICVSVRLDVGCRNPETERWNDRTGDNERKRNNYTDINVCMSV